MEIGRQLPVIQSTDPETGPVPSDSSTPSRDESPVPDPPSAPTIPLMRSEIFQQPAVLERLLAEELRTARQIATVLARSDPRYVVIAARGSSDNAARYGKYLFGSQLGLQVALATPSLFTLYGNPPSLRDAFVIGISQSGQSEDIVSVLAEARRQGVPTLAITNDTKSPLAAQADYLLDLHAGPERAVAATKTYTAQLAALALLAAAWHGDESHLDGLKKAIDGISRALRLEDRLQAQAAPALQASLCWVLGRGYNYATAYEIALKLKETAGVPAEPFSPADFMHGPIALLRDGSPVVLIAHSGAAFHSTLAFGTELKARGASLIVISDRGEAQRLADVGLRLADGIPEWSSPIVAVVPGQLLALHVALERGLDPDRPRGLSKVTRTR